ncbi:efflux RND transporter permease subunit [Pedobacter agri]|uniref:efflux RND transporter permease subunit n=1 Tax=Pedobacter agri TaxID=454586 RepID=UPI00292D9568|nr:efflux RND transporter permease subunit [Pedobacter agri]
MFEKFLKRPVLSTVVSVLIVIMGILGLIALPISQYPQIAPPTVQVTASYQGANAEVLLNSVLIPLEEQINGVEGMTYMTSTAANDGTATIMVNFELGVNPDIAAVNVQNRVSRATSLLPQEVVRSGVITQKTQNSTLLILTLDSKDPNFDGKFLQNYANINLVPQLKRVNGVGDVQIFAMNEYSMRIWLRPDVMASYGIVPADINRILADQNVESAPGQLGDQGKQTFQYTLKYRGRLKSTEEFGNMIVRSSGNGQILRLKDIARLELGAQAYSMSSRTEEGPAIGFAISQTAGSNAKEVIDNCKKVLDAASKSFPKGMGHTTFVDANKFLDASLDKVIHTLIEAFILVFVVVFIFLQDWRSTLIPAISVPVAIVGTFFFLNLFGFTINLLTLFALVLAIGIVVDDAIVVVEAVHAKLDSGYKSAKRASLDAMSEISGAIISITLVMAAVFIPVSFIQGSAGVFYKEFGLTLAIAIILSAINALTLSPALCAILLKSHDDKEHGAKRTFLQRFNLGFNTAFEKTTEKYKKGVSFFINRRWLAFTSIALFAGLFAYLTITSPKAFVPDEDTGVILGDLTLPPGSSSEETTAMLKKVENVVKDIPGVRNVFTITGRGIIAGSGSNFGQFVVRLDELDERQGKENQDASAILGKLFEATSALRNAKAIFFLRPTVQGFGLVNGFEFQLQDRSGSALNDFARISNNFLKELNNRPEIQFASTSFNVNYPQYQVNVNVAKVAEAGLMVGDILGALQGYIGGVYASNFNLYGKQYRVLYQAEPYYRADLDALNYMQVRTSSGKMVPITQFASLEKVYGPQAITRFNLFTSISVSGAPAQGFSSGDAIKAIEETAAQFLPSGYGYEYSGLTREELKSGSQTVYIFLLVIIFVYFLLSAQYESYLLPFAVLLSLPVGLAGAYIFTTILGIANNIYVQITLIMLVGLLAKNAILIVEFALDRRKKGVPLIEAAIQGAGARLRPILMTSFAFILGLVPLMIATGTGMNGNRSIGTAAVGGMLIGTVLGIFIIPALFVALQLLQEKLHDRASTPGDTWADIEAERLSEADNNRK